MMDKHIVFRLAEREFGIEIKSVVEILKAQKISVIPELPDFITGVITVRGDVIPVIDMRKRLGVKPQPTNERVIIVRSGTEKIGLVVDEVKEIAGFASVDIVPPPSIFKGLKTEYMKGLGKKKERIVILLDLARFLSAEERILLRDSAETPEAQ